VVNFLCDIPDLCTSNAQSLGYVKSTVTAGLSSCQDPVLLPQGNSAAHGAATCTKINIATSSEPLYTAEQCSPPRAGITADHKKETPFLLA